MDNYQDLLGQAEATFNEAKGIIENPEATAEDGQRVEPLIAEAKELQAKAMQLKEITDLGPSIAAAKAEAVKQNEGHEATVPSEFKGWSEFLGAAFLAGHREPSIRERDPRLVYFKDEPVGGTDEKQLVENTGASGGFLVPTEFLAQLQAVQAENSVVRSRATIIRMRRRQINIPVLDQTDTTTGQPNWFGGMIAYWSEEAAEKDLTTAKFRQASLTAHKLIMYTRSSDELLDDSAISLSDFLSGPLGMAGAVAWYEDYAFLQGTGAGQPLGVILAGATITVARQAQLTVGYIDLANMVENFLPTANPRTSVWVISPSLRSELMQVQDPAGNYVWQPNAREGQPQTIFGYPIVFSEKVPFRGTTGDVGIYDFSRYLLGDRQATTVESTQYDYWRYDQTSWRAVHRVDGQPWLSAPLTLQDGSSQVSPFVILGSKST